MSRHKITGLEAERDAAEAWLAEHDPEYVKRKYNWQTRSTDALARDRSEHQSLRDIHPIGSVGDGNYRRFPVNVQVKSRKFEHELLRTSTVSDSDSED